MEENGFITELVQLSKALEDVVALIVKPHILFINKIDKKNKKGEIKKMKSIFDFIKECYNGRLWDKIGISFWIIEFIFSIAICFYCIFCNFWIIKIIGIIILCFYSFAFGVLVSDDF